jgi:hypothetical protein
MHGKGEVKGSHWQFSRKVHRLNNDFSHFSKGYGTTTTFWRRRCAETQIWRLGWADLSMFSRKVQGFLNDFNHFSKGVQYHNHILETSAHGHSKSWAGV